MPKSQASGRKKGGHHWQRASNPARKAKRAKHFARLPEKRLRIILKHNGAKAAREWAIKFGGLAILERLV